METTVIFKSKFDIGDKVVIRDCDDFLDTL